MNVKPVWDLTTDVSFQILYEMIRQIRTTGIKKEQDKNGQDSSNRANIFSMLNNSLIGAQKNSWTLPIQQMLIYCMR